MITAYPFAITSINWQTWLQLVERVLSRSITKSLDVKNIPTGDLASFVSVLGEFHTEGSDAISIQREPGSLLRHIMISFIVYIDKYTLHEVLMHGKLSVIDCEDDRYYIMSANLEDWRLSVINYAALSSSHDLRLFAHTLMTELDKLGLSKIFDNFSRSTSSRGGLLLTKK